MPTTRDKYLNQSLYNSLANKDYITRLEDSLVSYYEDIDKETRYVLLECLTCYYLKPRPPRPIGGRAVTGYACISCQNVFTHPSTDVPKLCRECAKADNTCVRCTGNMDAKVND